jgi:hypothetical protein
MVKALIRKRLQEFQASRGWGGLVFLFVISLLPFLGVFIPEQPAQFLPVVIMAIAAFIMALGCPLSGFMGDYTNQANRFLEYLPLKRSKVWLVGYLSGLALLCLMAVTLCWLEVLLFPLGREALEVRKGAVLDPDLSYWHYFLPGRLAAVVFVSSTLIWLFSIVVFGAAHLDRKDAPTAKPQAPMILFAIFLPIGVAVFLGVFGTMPSAFALSPVLLTSAVLFSAGSYALFALTPRHITLAKRWLLSTVLFLATTAAFFGHLYAKTLTWRILDTSLPMAIAGVHKANLAAAPNLMLADVRSYRSGMHCVSIQLEDAAYHDLGRGLIPVETTDNRSGLLPFQCSRFGKAYFVSVAPDATNRRSVKLPGGRHYFGHSRWLPDKGLLLYTRYFDEDRQLYLCVADSDGKLLRRFPCGYAHFLVNAAGQALTIVPSAQIDVGQGRSVRAEKPYMLIDLESGSVERLALPGHALGFSKDLKRAICSRRRIREGKLYESYFVVELPSLRERPILAEDELPSSNVTAQVDLSVSPYIPGPEDTAAGVLRVNDAFDTALWVKQRFEADHLRYSINRVDLGTGKRQVAVPESALPEAPLVSSKEPYQPPAVEQFTEDQKGFIYALGPRKYHCDLKGQ